MKSLLEKVPLAIPHGQLQKNFTQRNNVNEEFVEKKFL